MALSPHVLKSRPHVEGGKFTCRLESCVKAFSQPGWTHLYGLSPVWILHGMRKQERGRMSARPLGDWLLNKPPQGHACPPTGVGVEWDGSPGCLSCSLTRCSAWFLLTACITQLKMGSSLLGEEGWWHGSLGTGSSQSGIQESSYSNSLTNA